MKPRYIYFDKETGMITDILATRKRGRAKYLTVDLEVVMPLLEGKKGMLDYVVAYDHDKKDYVLMTRDNIIKLRYYGKDLYKIPNKTIDDYDLRLELFVGGKALEVSIDPTRMSTMYATDLREEVCFEQGTEIRIFIKNKAGDKLLHTIVIDAQKLLENGQLFYELEGIDPNDVSFYTHRVFQNYMWRNGQARFLSPTKDRLRFEIQKADTKKRSPKFDYHLFVKQSDDGIEIENRIESLKLVKIFDDVEFFLVDKYDPTILYEKFILTPDAFKEKSIIIPTKETLENKTILYNHKHISVFVEG